MARLDGGGGAPRLAHSVAGQRAAIRTIAAMRGDHSLVPGGAPPATALTAAAVLVPLVDRPEGLTVLLTQRTQHLAAHAGQISFPAAGRRRATATPSTRRCARPRRRSGCRAITSR